MHMNYGGGERMVRPAPSIRQMQAWRYMLARGHAFDGMYFDEVTNEVKYTRNGTQFFIKYDGTIEKNEEVPVTTYEIQRVYVSDWREEGTLSGHR
jgi:hypothetical protein